MGEREAEARHRAQTQGTQTLEFPFKPSPVLPGLSKKRDKRSTSSFPADFQPSKKKHEEAEFLPVPRRAQPGCLWASQSPAEIPGGFPSSSGSAEEAGGDLGWEEFKPGHPEGVELGDPKTPWMHINICFTCQRKGQGAGMRAGGDRQPRRNSKSSSLQLRTAPGCPPPAPSTGFWGDQRLFPAPPQPLLPACPIQGQDLGFFWRWTGRRLLTEPSWGISTGRNLTSMPGRARRTPATPGPNTLVCLRGACRCLCGTGEQHPGCFVFLLFPSPAPWLGHRSLFLLAPCCRAASSSPALKKKKIIITFLPPSLCTGSAEQLGSRRHERY